MSESLDLAIDRKNPRGWPKTERQLRWAHHHVLEGLSAHAAALKAGYSQQTAKSRSFSLPRKLHPFLLRLQEEKNRIAEAELKVTVQRILEELAAIAFANIGDYLKQVTLQGGVECLVGKPLEELTPAQAAAVKSWRVVTREGEKGTILDYRYEFYDKLTALLALGKHVGMFNEQIQVQLHWQRARRERIDLSRVPLDVLEDAAAALRRVKEYAHPGATDQAVPTVC